MFQTLQWRLAPLAVLAVIVSIPLVQHGWKLHILGQTAQVAASHPATNAVVTGTPTRIVVPSAAIDLAVVAGAQDLRTKLWSVAPTLANYATNTAPANNQKGQTLIYGHNNHHVFGALLDLKIGDEAIVFTDNKHTFTYRFTGSRDVTPDRTDIFETLKQGTGLVLMTCDGNNFEYRHLMSFSLEKAS